MAFLNEGGGRFRKETIFAGPHPAYGSSGIQLVDMDGDGDLDVLYTNGDVMDPPPILKPYHGVQWLENEGRFPFKRPPDRRHVRRGAGRGGGHRRQRPQGGVACSYLPEELFPQRRNWAWMRWCC